MRNEEEMKKPHTHNRKCKDLDLGIILILITGSQL